MHLTFSDLIFPAHFTNAQFSSQHFFFLMSSNHSWTFFAVWQRALTCQKKSIVIWKYNTLTRAQDAQLWVVKQGPYTVPVAKVTQCNIGQGTSISYPSFQCGLVCSYTASYAANVFPCVSWLTQSHSALPLGAFIPLLSFFPLFPLYPSWMSVYGSFLVGLGRKCLLTGSCWTTGWRTCLPLTYYLHIKGLILYPLFTRLL